MEIKKLKEIAENFCDELIRSQKGEKTSLQFIKNPLQRSPFVKNGELFESLVMGGSNFKKALMRRQNGTLEIFKRSGGNKPPLETKQEFLEFIESHVDLRINSFGLNFAYPINPVLEDGKLDGILEFPTKEDKFEGLIGKKVGRELEIYFENKYNKKIRFAVANDTIGLLLSGLNIGTWDSLVGGIVGTGINFGFFLSEHEAVNLESAGFDRFSQTKEGILIDNKSLSPGKALFEKETAGKYLYQHFNLMKNEMGIKHEDLKSTFEMNKLLKQPVEKVTPLAKYLFERSAQLVSTQVAGILLYKQRDMTFVMEGSLFYKAREYKSVIKQMVQKITKKYNATFVRLEDSGIMGAARLVA